MNKTASATTWIPIELHAGERVRLQISVESGRKPRILDWRGVLDEHGRDVSFSAAALDALQKQFPQVSQQLEAYHASTHQELATAIEEAPQPPQPTNESSGEPTANPFGNQSVADIPWGNETQPESNPSPEATDSPDESENLSLEDISLSPFPFAVTGFPSTTSSPRLGLRNPSPSIVTPDTTRSTGSQVDPPEDEPIHSGQQRPEETRQQSWADPIRSPRRNAPYRSVKPRNESPEPSFPTDNRDAGTRGDWRQFDPWPMPAGSEHISPEARPPSESKPADRVIASADSQSNATDEFLGDLLQSWDRSTREVQVPLQTGFRDLHLALRNQIDQQTRLMQQMGVMRDLLRESLVAIQRNQQELNYAEQQMLELRALLQDLAGRGINATRRAIMTANGR